MRELFEALTRINFWNKPPGFQLGFERSEYLSRILRSTGNKLIKVLVGQRRSGKSYILRQIMDQLINSRSIRPENILYLNMEYYDFEALKTAGDLDGLIKFYRKKLKPEGKIFLFIDEVQNIEGWEKIVVSLAQDVVEDFEIFITGSNSRLLSGEFATLLSGRYLVFEVFPFSYDEYLEFHELTNKRENFLEYLKTTALPEIYNIDSIEIHRHYFQSLKDTILLKDIMYRYKIRDYVLLEDLFLFIVHNVGNMVSIPSIVKYYKSRSRKVDYSTIAAFIGYMEEAFILRQCPKWHIKTRELLSGEKKYYINDLGFRNYLFPQLIDDIAAMLENVVYLHLLRAGFEVRSGHTRNYEVDFVAERGNEKIYIQVTYMLTTKETANREYRPLEMIDDNHPKYLVSMDEINLHHSKGIAHQNVWKFIHPVNKYL